MLNFTRIYILLEAPKGVWEGRGGAATALPPTGLNGAPIIWISLEAYRILEIGG